MKNNENINNLKMNAQGNQANEFYQNEKIYEEKDIANNESAIQISPINKKAVFDMPEMFEARKNGHPEREMEVSIHLNNSMMNQMEDNNYFEENYYYGDFNQENAPMRRMRRTGTLKNKYEDIFSLAEGQEKLTLDKVNINGRYYYSMWQLKQKLSEKMPLDVSRKNKLRYIIQNRTKKDNPENVIKLLTRPAKEEMELGKHLLTPNKYSTFISIDEFKEGGSFGFISGIIQDFVEDIEKVYRTSPKSLGKLMNLPNLQFPPNIENNQMIESNSIPFIATQYGEKTLIIPNLYQLNASNYTQEVPQHPNKAQMYPSQNHLFREGEMIEKKFQLMDPNEIPTSYENIHHREFPIKKPENIISRVSHISSNLETKKNSLNFLMNNKSSITPNEESLSNSSEEIIEEKGEETNYVVGLLCGLQSNEGNPNKRSQETSPKKKDKSNKKLRLSPSNNAISIFGNVPILNFNSKGSIYKSNVNGNEIHFITSIDYKNLLIEQLDIKDKNKINSVAQSIENALSSESPRFDITTYNSYFEFTGRNNYTRIFILHHNKIVKQKYHIYRDHQNNRWLLKMLKNYKYINHSTVFIINDSQLEKKIYNGPTEKIVSLMENIGNTFVQTISNNSDEYADPFIDVLLFKDLNDNVKVSKDQCNSNTRYILNIYGQNLSKQQYTSLIFSISPVALCYKLYDFEEDLYSFEDLQIISFDCLFKFVNQICEDESLLDSLYPESFYLPITQDFSIRPFFLKEMNVPGKFHLKSISHNLPIWNLYLYSLNKLIIIDCSNFKKKQLDPTNELQDYHEKICNLHFNGTSFFSNYVLPHQSLNFPPDFSIQLVSNPFKVNEKNIQDIYIPPLKEGNYLFWISYFIGANPIESFSKEFIVEN